MQAQLKALAAEIVLDNGDPPDTDYQRGYMAACEEIARRLNGIANDQKPDRAKMLALVEWAAQYGREMGRARAEVVVPTDGPAVSLEDYVRSVAIARWRA
jgi:hypothetical protein